MLLPTLLIISLIFAAVVRFSILHHFEFLTSFLHAKCLERLPVNATALPELKALVCAENFSGLFVSEVFVTSGLIHLFVVSGAHLLVLQNIYDRLLLHRDSPLAKNIFFVILFIYGAACEFNSPVSRSVIAIFLMAYLASHKLYWPKHYCLLLVGLATLIIEPAWLQSISLQLSWLAAFVVNLNTEFFRHKNFIFKQSLYFFALLPILIYFQIPSPLVIVMNLIFTPILEFILFPLGLLVWLIPGLHPLFDSLIELLKFILNKINLQWHFQPESVPSNLILFNWAFIFALHVVIHFAWMKRKRFEAIA